MTLDLPSCVLEADGSPGLGTYANFLQNIFRGTFILYCEVWLFFQGIMAVGSIRMVDLLLLGQDIELDETSSTHDRKLQLCFL